jgi:acyl carrier protein
LRGAGNVDRHTQLDSNAIDPKAILGRLRRLASEVLRLDLRDEELADMDRLDEMAGLDSLTIALFVVTIEKDFGITLGAGDLKRETVADLPRLAQRIAAHLAARC